MSEKDELWIPPRWLARVGERVRDGLALLHRRSTVAPVAMLELAMGAWLSQALYAAAQLQVADALAHGPRSAEELARELSVDSGALHRLLRALSQHGVFRQRSGRTFANSALSETLRSDVPGSIRDYVLFLGHPKHRDHWSTLDLVVRQGKGHDLFAELAQDRELGDVFDQAMTSLSALGDDAMLAAYDFGAFSTVVDVGGGRGANLAGILRASPSSRGILFDLPEVTAGAPELLARLGVRERVQVEGGSFFERVPTGGDAYVLKHILHDWSDQRALAILQTVRRAMAVGAHLLLVESVVPEGPEPHLAKLIDLEMLIIGGKERTRREFEALLQRAGFALTRVVPTAGPVSIVEAKPLGFTPA